MKAIADTGFLVAFANRRDTHHRWAFELAAQITEPLLTCEPVLAETAFHLGDVPLVMQFIETGLIKVSFILEEHLSRIAELGRRYFDRQPDLADLCLIRMSELYPKHPVITTDVEDFRVYRRNRRDLISLLHPPIR